MASPESRLPEEPPTDALRALIVDDSLADGMIAAAAVARAATRPYVLQKARSLNEALELLASNGAHLVLLDLNLPDSAGLDTVRRVRAATGAPIIVVTVDDTPDLDESAREAGAFGVLRKGRIGVDVIAELLRRAESERRP